MPISDITKHFQKLGIGGTDNEKHAEYLKNNKSSKPMFTIH